jgi:hypothetical protein
MSQPELRFGLPVLKVGDRNDAEKPLCIRRLMLVVAAGMKPRNKTVVRKQVAKHSVICTS